MLNRSGLVAGVGDLPAAHRAVGLVQHAIRGEGQASLGRVAGMGALRGQQARGEDQFNEAWAEVEMKGRAEGLKPRIYTHPIGIHGHGSGMMVGMVEKQEFVPGTGEHPLYPNTVYSIELSAAYEIPEWENKLVSLGFEEEAVFTADGANWVDGYPRSFYLIK